MSEAPEQPQEEPQEGQEYDPSEPRPGVLQPEGTDNIPPAEEGEQQEEQQPEEQPAPEQ